MSTRLLTAILAVLAAVIGEYLRGPGCDAPHPAPSPRASAPPERAKTSEPKFTERDVDQLLRLERNKWELDRLQSATDGTPANQ